MKQLMKQLLSLSLSALLLFCLTTTHAQKQETLEGNGNRVTKTINVQSFTELDASGVYELQLTQGNSESVTIEADENLQLLFTVRNDGRKLVIEMKDMKNKNLNVKKNMVVHVQFKNLKAMDLKTVGSIKSTNDLSFDDLELSNSSVGNVDLDLNATKLNLENRSVGDVILSGRAEEAVMKNNGVGSLKAGNFVVQTLDIDNSGVGSAEVNATKGLKVRDSFLGKVKNRGAAPVRNMKKVVI
jgi:hypothetical protein